MHTNTYHRTRVLKLPSTIRNPVAAVGGVVHTCTRNKTEVRHPPAEPTPGIPRCMRMTSHHQHTYRHGGVREPAGYFLGKNHRFCSPRLQVACKTTSTTSCPACEAKHVLSRFFVSCEHAEKNSTTAVLTLGTTLFCTWASKAQNTKHKTQITQLQEPQPPAHTYIADGTNKTRHLHEQATKRPVRH